MAPPVVEPAPGRGLGPHRCKTLSGRGMTLSTHGTPTAVFLVQPKHRLGHPKNDLFLL